jgi:hypothetical protein
VRADDASDYQPVRHGIDHREHPGRTPLRSAGKACGIDDTPDVVLDEAAAVAVLSGGVAQ